MRCEGCGLGDEVGDQVASLDRREPADIENVLLRIHSADLSARLGQRVDDRDRQATKAGVVRREETGRTSTDDSDVYLAHIAVVPLPLCTVAQPPLAEKCMKPFSEW